MQAGPGDEDFTDMSKLVSDAVEHLKIKMEAPETITGISTCFPSLDYYTSGLQRGDLVVVAGRPSMGKGIFARNIARHVALVHNLPVAIVDMQTGGEALAIRMLASMAKIDCHDLRKGRIGHNEFERLEEFVGVLKKASIYFSLLTPVSVEELGEQLRELTRRIGGLGLVVVDCLPELMLSGELMNDEYANRLVQISRYLKALAKELDIPIVVLSQIERGVEERCNKRPVLSDLPGLGAIANAADLVLMVYRDEVYDPESEAQGTANIIVSRNREGSIGSFSLRFEGRYQSFEEMIEW
jgi:replicative DNA helicase